MQKSFEDGLQRSAKTGPSGLACVDWPASVLLLIPRFLLAAFLVACLPPAGTPALADKSTTAADADAEPAQAPGPAEPADADAVFDRGRYAEAAELYRNLADTAAARGDEQHQWEAQLKLGYSLGLLGRDADADREIKVAMQLADGNSAREGWTRVRTGSLLSRRGEFSLARAQALRAQQLAEIAADPELDATAWYLLGEINSLTGRYHDAVSAGERRLEILRRLGASEAQLAHALGQVAIDYRHLGRHSAAMDSYAQALAVYRRLDNPEAQARILYNLANVHAATGDLPQAVALMKEALENLGRTGSARGLALVLNGLADLYRRAGNRGAAAAHLARALDINRGSGQPYGETTNLLSLGGLASDAGQHGLAEERLGTAMALADQHGYERQRAAARAALAHVAVRQGDTGPALKWAEEAARIAQSLDDPEAQLEAAEARGAAFEAAGRSEAAASYTEGIDILESWRARLAFGDLRMSVAEPRWRIYEGAIRVLIEEGRAAEAFEVAERARARLLLEIMAERDASRTAASPSQSLRQRLRDWYAQRAAPADGGSAIRPEHEIEGIESALAELEQAARARNPASAAALYPSPASVAAIQEGLLRTGSALLAFFWGERDVYGWWITGGEVRAARLGRAQALASRVEFLRAAIAPSPGGPPWKAPARAVFDALLAPLSATPAEDIFVIADGPLAHLPLEVLLPGDAAEPLAVTTRITYAPSASVLLGLVQSKAARRWERSILVVGDPLPADDGSAAAAEQRTGALAPLPFAAAEARAIHELFRGDGAVLLLGAEASLDAWKELEPARYRYLHFAAHARVSSRMPAQTHLVLADSRLDLAGIRELELNAELVTLSACDTGRGRPVRGEGIVGLSHAFLSAGASGTLVTLWRVDDAAAAEFMQRFYRLLRGGRTPADALLAVRRELARANSAAPYQWAPFVLVGGL